MTGRAAGSTGRRARHPAEWVVALEQGEPWPPALVILGEEALCATEAADALVRIARARGFDRTALTVDSGFDWSRLASACVDRSLFGGAVLIDLDLTTGKPGAAGGKALQEALVRVESAQGDLVLLVRLPRPDGDMRRSAWFKALERVATVLHCRPVAREALPDWLRSRAQRAGIELEPEAAVLAATWLEGNLPAGAQAVARWQLRGTKRVDLAAVVAELNDGARFALFDLEGAVVAGDAVRAAGLVERLLEDGTPMTLLVWLLSRDLHALRAAMGGERAFLPGISAQALSAAARRVSARRVDLLLSALADVDRRSKGRVFGDVAGVDRMLIGEIAAASAGGRVLRLPTFFRKDRLWQSHLGQRLSGARR
ncbi:MAG: DNA polymerase III subunit delta [Thioalkalivibrionaceae bacterium]